MKITQKLEEATTKFNNKFTYILKDACKVTDKIVVICPYHGEFTQEVRVHLRSKHGCPECANKAASKLQAKTTEQFIKEAKIKHNNKYTYNYTFYTGDTNKVTITCPIHGDFSQTAGSHIGKDLCGCPTCGTINSREKQRLPIEDAVEKMGKLPKNITFNKESYVSMKLPALFTCKFHGTFSKSPVGAQKSSLVCPECSNSNKGWSRSLYKGVPTTLYLLKLHNSLFKVGITKSNDVWRRYKKSEHLVIDKILFQATLLEGTKAYDFEKQILKEFAQYKYTGAPVFIDTGITEILTINPINKIKELINAYQQL